MFDYKIVDNKEEYLKLMQFAFSIEQEFWPRMVESADWVFASDKRDIYGAYNGEELAAEYLLLSLKMRLRGTVIPMGGIGNVCTRSTYRGKGAIKFLLENSLKTMKENGQAVSVLYPFLESFYRKYGWENFDSLLKLKVSLGALKIPEIKEEIEIEEMMIPDNDVMEFYNEYAANHYNMIQNDDPFWKEESQLWIKKDVARNFVKFSKNGKTTGLMKYILINKDFFTNETEFIVRLFITEDLETKKAMFKFLTGLSHQISEINILLPQDYLIWPYLNAKPAELKTVNRSMIRIVDLEGLTGLKIDCPDTSVKVDVTDKQADWNNGVFKLSVENGELNIEKASDPELSCDINILSSVISGFTNFKEMIECEKVKVLAGYKSQDFPKETTFVLQHF